ncbi:MAG TPA: hypothetical protein VGO09_10115 [Flavisolibacter sp.]|nr:hypothetical protein [Flavisolibacter sp.]
MKKVFKSNDFIIASLLVVIVSICSFISISRANNICSFSKSCQKPNISGTSDMFWDVFPRQFVNTILFQ